MKKVKSVIIVILIIVAAFFYAHIGKNNLVYDKDVDNSQYIATGPVNRVEQTFVSKEETLDGFRSKCQVAGNVEGMKVQYSLVNVKSGKTEAEGIADAAEIKNSKFYFFGFDTVSNCKGNAYKIVLVNEKATEKDGIGFFFQPKTEQGTSLKVEDNSTTGTMIVKAVTDRFDIETFIVLLVFVLYVVLFIKFLYKLFK
ncbi:MAG: hypothetical protein QM793_09075 [Muricomes sp.]